MTRTVNSVSVDSLVVVGMEIAINNESGASNVTHNSATLGGTVTVPQGTADVFIYWGTADGGETTNWDNDVTLFGLSSGDFPHPCPR